MLLIRSSLLEQYMTMSIAFQDAYEIQNKLEGRPSDGIQVQEGQWQEGQWQEGQWQGGTEPSRLRYRFARSS
jgi:hypothetical protein